MDEDLNAALIKKKKKKKKSSISSISWRSCLKYLSGNYKVNFYMWCGINM